MKGSRRKAISHAEAFKSACRFITARCGARWMAPFVGSDFSAFEAFCCLVELWTRADTSQRGPTLISMQACVRTLQESVRHFAYLAIIAISDWELTGALVPRLLIEGDTTSLVRFREVLRSMNELLLLHFPLELRLRAHPPRLQLRLWEGGPLLDLSTSAGANGLLDARIEDLTAHGWSQDQAFHWLYGLQELVQSAFRAIPEQVEPAAAPGPQ